MTAATLTAPPRTRPVPAGGPRQKLWTVEQFHRLGDLGTFEGRRAMLVHGEILEEGPMNPPHAIAGTKTEDLIREAFGRGWHVRVQKPLVLGKSTDPEPDIAVVPGRPGDYSSHPASADLVVEIGDTSLDYDTHEKMSLYAAAAIREYWVLDVNGRQLLVHRDPVADPAAPFGFKYATVRALGPADRASPLAVPTAGVLVSEMLP